MAAHTESPIKRPAIKRTAWKALAPLRNPEAYQYDLNLRDIAEVWRSRSVASWQLDLTVAALTQDPQTLEFCRPGLHKLTVSRR